MNINGRHLVLTIRKPSLQTFLLYLWFFNLITLAVARYFLTALGLYTGTVREFILWLVASVPLIACLLYIRRIGWGRVMPFCQLFGLVLLAYCFTALANPEVAPYLFRTKYGPERIFRPNAPMFAALFFLLFDDPEELKKNVTTYAYLFFAYEMVFSLIPALQRGYWINVGSAGQEIHIPYSLSFGYTMCFPTVVFLYNSIKYKKPIHILLSLAGLWCIVTNGNRGALIIPLIFCALMFIGGILDNQNTSKKVLKISAIVLGCLLLYIFGNYLLGGLLSFLSMIGISSRNVEMLRGGSFAEDNGRNIIWMACFNAIKEGGILGRGIYGDRPIVAPIHYVGYSHNLFLELLVSFGIIGAVIIIRIILDGVRMIFMCRDRGWRELYIIFFSISCQLLLSLSFWYVWEFWAAAAIAYSYRRVQRNERISR